MIGQEVQMIRQNTEWSERIVQQTEIKQVKQS